MARRFDQPWIAGTFIQQAGRGVSSLAGLSVASVATVRRFAGSNEFRGIATINSGTTIASVSAAAAASGSVIWTNPIQFTLDASSANFCMVTMARSVRAGAFEITTAGSVAPAANMPVAWAIIA